MKINVSLKFKFIAGWRHWRGAVNWLFWSCILGLSPVWLSLLLFLALGERHQAGNLFSLGQLAPYAAAMAGTAMYLGSTDREPRGMRFRGSIMLTSVIVTLFASVIFATVQTLSIVNQRFHIDLSVDPGLIIGTSTAVYLAGAAAAFLATLVDSERLDSAYNAIQEVHTSDLLDQFHETERAMNGDLKRCGALKPGSGGLPLVAMVKAA